MIAIEKIVLIIIFLIILVICIYILTGIVKPSGETINLQNQIRQCCNLYRANGCPDDRSKLRDITCGDSNLNDLINKVPMTTYQLKAFCGC
jgi:hypothetical protein